MLVQLTHMYIQQFIENIAGTFASFTLYDILIRGTICLFTVSDICPGLLVKRPSPRKTDNLEM